MKQHTVFAGMWLVLTAAVAGCTSSPAEQGVVYQYAPIRLLMEGRFDGDMTVGELLRHGNVGIGTFNTLDGEMVILDGLAYQARADGNVCRVADDQKVPFAVVAQLSHELFTTAEDKPSDANLAIFCQAMDNSIGQENLMAVVVAHGRFSHMKVRSVSAQKKPYPRLSEAAKSQAVFQRKGVSGTLVAFRCPAYMTGVNVPGWHMHFLSDDRQFGGHVLDFAMSAVHVESACYRELRLIMPEGSDALAGSTDAVDKELHTVEKGR